MAASARSGRGPDLPILLIAILVATAATLFVGSRLTMARCRDAGGQVRVSGMDQVCEGADGRTIATEPLLTGAGSAAGVGLWLVLIGGSYAGMRAYLRGRPARG